MKKSLLNFAAAVLNIVLTVILIRRYGIIGAAVGTGIGVLVGLIGVNWLLKHYHCCEIARFYREIYSRILPSAAGMMILGGGLRKILYPDNWLVFLWML